ncbi:M23 family metallopeptidase [Tessaracoccus rhinocerotis]|uniref:M23 family metallopeptidase n=2 Tax=Tessaracoccus rhinocerotis TaxID=1689449 RepID=A0A553K038_9ACTN|nr:M23 family metallopeptidase [Tessaracoccus rhinocerotis]
MFAYAHAVSPEPRAIRGGRAAVRRMRVLIHSTVAAVVLTLAGLLPQPAHAAELPDFPMALPVAWGATVQAGGTHTHASGVRSSVDLGALNGASIPVTAVADGVASVKPGCSVTVTHADGWQTQYYHLRSIPSGLDGAQVVAGQRVGMTAMPGSETCGRGSFRHVHLTLMRNGEEMAIDGLSLGGYTIHTTGRSYCGFWSRDSDGVVVADAQRACLAVPSLANNIVNPANLAARGIDGPSRSTTRPVIADADTITAELLYITEGNHTVGGRAWATDCEPYSQTERCFTDIWATQVIHDGGGYKMVEGWAFNNLTYKALPRAAWAKNPLGHTAEWVSDDGRSWYTECDTAATGRGGCRSYIMATTYSAQKNAWGLYEVDAQTKWVFNNMVRFTPASEPVAAAAAAPQASAIPTPAQAPSPTVAATEAAVTVTEPAATESAATEAVATTAATGTVEAPAEG